ncbi:hypothetical protein SAMN06266982_1278 [Propioniciclava tarda]|nr:hypothetical protein SAMN06266982_1278 [Propioniciclava tarda]
MWGFVSIGASSALTVVLTVVAARGGAQMLGEFAACLSAYVVGAAVCRALVPDVAIVTARSDDNSRELRAREGATMLVVAATLPLMSLIVALQAQAPAWTTLLLSLLMAGPVLQDSARFLLIARDSYRVAAVADLLALVSLSALLGALILLGRSISLLSVVSVWSAVTFGAAVWVLVRSRALPSVRGGMNFLLGNRRLAAGFLTDSGLTMVGSQTVLSMMSALAGVPALGAWRAAQSAMGPFGTVFQAVQPLAIRHASVSGAAKRMLGQLAAGSAFLAAMAALASHLLTTILSPLGKAVFSQAWGDVQAIIVPATVYLVGSWLTLVPVVFFRSTKRAGSLAALRGLSVSIQIIAAAVAFSLIDNFAQACQVIAGVQFLVAVVWWGVMYISVRHIGGDVAA